MKNFALLSSVTLILLITPGLKGQTEDAWGCKDHPMFNRIPNYRIDECMVKESGAFNFPVESRIAEDVKKQAIEGKFYFYSYLVEDGEPETSSLLIFRDLDNKLKENSGSIIARVIELGNLNSFITGKIVKDNMDTWIFIQAVTHGYQLNIVEKKRKIQFIKADSMWNALDKKGSISLDIFFDDDTTTIIPASFPLIDQIYQLLVNHPSVKLSIQCHTDNVIKHREKKVLSAERAKIVLDALTAKGIVKTRLTSLGWGYDKPVADNSTEEGRAQNRRVVIVKN